jgi:hypothetical protein
MRTLRLSLAGAVILMLLGAWTSAVAAQEAADPMAPAFFTYTTEPVGESTMPEGMVVGDDQDMQMVEATDPRASGLVIISANSNLIELGDGAIMTAVMSERLTNEGGAWSGTGRFVMAGSGDSGVMASMGVLTGEGDYEGLTLIMGQSEGAGPMSNWGVILPSDQVPPMPDPVQPPTD